MTTHFTKYQGTGNDFIMVDDRKGSFPADNISLIRSLCDRRFGIGADGLILLQPDAEADFFMKYFNSDGRESSMCGNGGRCIAAFARQIGLIKDNSRFRAIDGMHFAEVKCRSDIEYLVKLQMKDVTEITVNESGSFIMDTGSPHYVSFTTGSVHHLDLIPLAHEIRYKEPFKEKGINVNFIHKNKDALTIRTYERGVEDETLSCGTGVTASAIAYAVSDRLETGEHLINLETKGGPLSVRFIKNPDLSFTEVYLIGPAVKVFEGNIDL